MKNLKKAQIQLAGFKSGMLEKMSQDKKPISPWLVGLLSGAGGVGAGVLGKTLYDKYTSKDEEDASPYLEDEQAAVEMTPQEYMQLMQMQAQGSPYQHSGLYYM